MVKPIPDGYHSVSPYLIVCEAARALDFYRRAFGAQERRRLTTPDGKVMHAEIIIGDSIVMLSDEFPDHGAIAPKRLDGCAIFVVLYVEEVDARIEQAVGAGATILRPVADQFFGDRSGTLRDPFGHRWTLTTHIEDVSDAEIDRRFAQMFTAQ